MEVIARAWYAFANAVGSFIEEAIFRTSLAWAVLRGKSPKPAERRPWDRAREAPILIEVYAWTDDRHIFSVLVWPSLEVPSERATHTQRARARQVIRVINGGAAEMAWSTRYEVTYGLEWDHTRQVWTPEVDLAYDGSRVATGSRRYGA